MLEYQRSKRRPFRKPDVQIDVYDLNDLHNRAILRSESHQVTRCCTKCYWLTGAAAVPTHCMPKQEMISIVSEDFSQNCSQLFSTGLSPLQIVSISTCSFSAQYIAAFLPPKGGGSNYLGPCAKRHCVSQNSCCKCMAPGI